MLERVKPDEEKNVFKKGFGRLLPLNKQESTSFS